MENQVETLNNRTFRHSLSSSLQNANSIRHYHETQPYWFTLAQIASNGVSELTSYKGLSRWAVPSSTRSPLVFFALSIYKFSNEIQGQSFRSQGKRVNKKERDLFFRDEVDESESRRSYVFFHRHRRRRRRRRRRLGLRFWCGVGRTTDIKTVMLAGRVSMIWIFFRGVSKGGTSTFFPVSPLNNFMYITSLPSIFFD